MGKHVHSLEGINAAAVGRNVIAYTVEAFPDAVARVERIIVEQEGGADAKWNVELNGQALIGGGGTAESGVVVTASDTPQSFQPNAPNRSNLLTANANDPIEFRVLTGASGENDTINVSVLTDDNRD